MRILSGSFIEGLLVGSRGRFVLCTGAVVALSVAAIACSGDDDDPSSSPQASGSVATATATTPATPPEVSPTSVPTVGGTLVPLPSATPTPTPSTSTGAQTPAPDVVGMIDMAPCGDETHFEEISLPSGIPALAYKDVPEGTPILFPFEAGRMLELDSREGATTVFYEVSDGSIFTLQVAGASSMDRNATNPVRGTVIGHFGGTFGEQLTDALPGYQLVAVAGTEELLAIGGEVYSGVALEPDVTDCLVLP